MLRIAVVDDDRKVTEKVSEYIHSFCSQNGHHVLVTEFSDGSCLLENYTSEYDIIFLDIKMKHMDGVETAEQIRKTDPDTILIFLTQTVQYALAGYKVDAMDYMIKPVDYYSFELVFRKALRRLEQNRPRMIVLNVNGNRRVIQLSQLCYVEVYDHYLTYHTIDEDIRMKGTLADAKKELAHNGFFQCSRYMLVNIRYISAVNQKDIVVCGRIFDISRPRRRELIGLLAETGGEIR